MCWRLLPYSTTIYVSVYHAFGKHYDSDQNCEYIIDDLKVSIINAIESCLNLGHDEGGYFGVPRLVLIYVDYLAALYMAPMVGDKRTNRRVFADSQYAEVLLNDVLGYIDPNYSKYHSGNIPKWVLYTYTLQKY